MERMCKRIALLVFVVCCLLSPRSNDLQHRVSTSWEVETKSECEYVVIVPGYKSPNLKYSSIYHT